MVYSLKGFFFSFRLVSFYALTHSLIDQKQYQNTCHSALLVSFFISFHRHHHRPITHPLLTNLSVLSYNNRIVTIYNINNSWLSLSLSLFPFQRSIHNTSLLRNNPLAAFGLSISFTLRYVSSFTWFPLFVCLFLNLLKKGFFSSLPLPGAR